MSPSRSSSPAFGAGGGWSSPGLHTASGRTSPASGHVAPSRATMATTNNGPYLPPRSPSNNMRGVASGGRSAGAFFARHIRKWSNSLPRFHDTGYYSEKDKKAEPRAKLVLAVKSILSRTSRKLKVRMVICLVLLLLISILYHSPLRYYWRRGAGGGRKFVIILGANVGGGVSDMKGAREWAIERDSIRNKEKYAAQWGYNLDIVDMRKRKKYAHEWRESWEKVDFIRDAMQKYPDAEWFWWLDITTVIMEPTYSLQSHLFNDLSRHVYRDINEYNPLNISHPITAAHLTAEDRSPVGDGRSSSIHLVLAQDCSGFNLGSFMIRRSPWAERLLDVWWDPVAYEQKHMEWEHKEQDALELLYTSHAWVRKHVGFAPQRKLNSFPPGACVERSGGQKDDRIHYDQKGRDFLVNMAGCEWGRDCWHEMYDYRELSYRLNRNPWEKFKGGLVVPAWRWLMGQKVKL